MQDYKVLPLTTEDKAEATIFLRNYFTQGEPMGIAAGVTRNRSFDPQAEALFFSSIGTPINFKAVSQDGEMIAIKLNCLVSRTDKQGKEAEATDAVYREIFKFFDFVNEKANVFGKYYNVDRILSGSALAVHPAWTRRGIGKVLMEKTWEATCQQNCGLMKISATSLYTSKMLSRMGFRCIYSLNYKDYEGHEGIKNDVQAPHTSIDVFIKENGPQLFSIYE